MDNLRAIWQVSFRRTCSVLPALRSIYHYKSRRLPQANRVSPAIEVRHSYEGTNMVAMIELVTSVYGVPKTIRVDNSPEFVSKELDLWAYMNGVELVSSRPGNSTDNAFVVSFNSSFRPECLNVSCFLSLGDPRSKCEAWRRDYNEIRLHNLIGNKAPAELLNEASGPACRP